MHLAILRHDSKKQNDMKRSDTPLVKNNILKLKRLENEMLKFDQLDVPVKHYFSNGVYAREMFMKEGTILTGKIHKHRHLNILLEGDVTLSDESGVKRLKAPYIFESKEGTKRAFYAHKDTRWLTIHQTFETDLDKIEQDLIAEEYNELLEQIT